MKKIAIIACLALTLAGCAIHPQKAQIDPSSGAVVNATSRRQYVSRSSANVDPAIDAAESAAWVAVDWVGDILLFPLP